MDRKRRVLRLIDTYVNDIHKESIETFYGPNTYVKIHNITFSYTKPTAVVEVVMNLGDIISEEVLDTELITVLVNQSFSYILPDHSVMCYVRWDV